MTYFLASTVRMAIPLMIAALGLVVSERAGLMNIGVEGIMLFGCFFSFFVSFNTGSTWLGLAAGMAAGCIASLIFAVATITFKASQIVVGCAMNMLGSGLTAVMFRKYFMEGNINGAMAESFQAIAIPGLSKIPLIGDMLFNHNIIVYVGYVLVFAVWFVMNRTSIGVKIIAVGEHPKAADSLGINVFTVRYLSTAFSGLMMGLAGVYLAIALSNTFQTDMTGGKGYIAMAVVVLGQWRALGVMAGALVFGAAQALQMVIQNAGVAIHYNLVLAIPYVVTVIAVVISGRTRSIEASAKGTPYIKS